MLCYFHGGYAASLHDARVELVKHYHIFEDLEKNYVNDPKAQEKVQIIWDDLAPLLDKIFEEAIKSIENTNEKEDLRDQIEEVLTLMKPAVMNMAIESFVEELAVRSTAYYRLKDQRVVS